MLPWPVPMPCRCHSACNSTLKSLSLTWLLVTWPGVSALPTIILNGWISLVGVIPVEPYRLLCGRMLAGELGWLIPLDFNAPETRAAGQSAIGEVDAI